MSTTFAQHKVTSVDLNRYSGKWYIIASIPTRFDRNWNFITESYHVNEKGTIDVFTTYKKDKDSKERSATSKGFPIKETNNVSWKVQFVWPFKADYLIEELADDYTYVVVGHPRKKFLYIMNRSGKMGNLQYEEIVDRFAKKGYEIKDLHKVEQGF